MTEYDCDRQNTNTRADKRTTVSLAEVIWKMAEKQMEAKGFNYNFSAYVADLIRRDKERESQRQQQVENDLTGTCRMLSVKDPRK